MKKKFFTVITLCITISMHGQEISRDEADALLKSLAGSNVATNKRLESLLALASFNILKSGELKADLDSAQAFMTQAENLNSKLHIPEAGAHLHLLTAYLTRERGKDLKELFVKAVDALKSTKDSFHLAMAKLELSKYYSSDIPAELPQKVRLLDDAVALLQQNGSLSQKKYGLIELRYNYQFSGVDNIPWKISFSTRMIAIARQVSGDEGVFLVQKDIIETNLQQGRPSIAAIESLKLLEAYKAKGYSHICIYYHLAARALYYQGNFNKALFYAYETLKNVKSAEDSLNLLSYYYKIYDIYNVLGNRESAMEWLRKILDYTITAKRKDPLNTEGHIYVASATIVAHLILEKKSKAALSFISDIRNKFPPTNTGSKKNYALSMAKCYAAMQKNELAERYYLDMLNFSELQAKEDVGGNYIYPANKEIGWFYLSAGNLQKAEKHLNTAFKEWTPVNSPNRLVFKSAYMFKLDSSYGRYLLAIQHLQRIQLNKDSIFTATKSKQVEELQIVYQTEQQKSDIKNLQNNEKMQQIKLQQAENTKNLIIAVAAMLLLLLGVIYNRYLLKQKSNRLLQAQREEIAAVNESLNNLVKEKEWLLKEVHHRVKNNLQTVVSLLELQSENLHDEALSAIQDSQSRIYAMSLIHQKLYQTDNVASINMQPYLLELTDHLQAIYNPDRKISFDLQVAPLVLDVSQAIPVGLIVNEAVTNSIKYAFNYPAHRPQISIALDQHEKQAITLTISDNGIGLPLGFDSSDTNGLGFKLMNGLVEDIEGRLTIESDEGTIIIVAFNGSVPFVEKTETPELVKAFAL